MILGYPQLTHIFIPLLTHNEQCQCNTYTAQSFGYTLSDSPTDVENLLPKARVCLWLYLVASLNMCILLDREILS